MKGLDTPVLLGILHGDPRCWAVVRRSEGEELATTEWNMFELEAIVHLFPAKLQEHRRAALGKLRRRLSVIPIDSPAVSRATEWLKGRQKARADLLTVICAAAESRGCTEWITTKRWAPSVRTPRMRVTAL